MLVTRKDILDAAQTLLKLVNQSFGNPKDIYDMARRSRTIKGEIEDLERVRVDTVRQYAVRDDEGKPIQDERQNVKLNDIEAYEKQWLGFIVEECEFDIKPIPYALVAEMKEKDKAVFSAMEIGLLIPFMTGLPEEE